MLQNLDSWKAMWETCMELLVRAAVKGGLVDPSNADLAYEILCQEFTRIVMVLQAGGAL